MKVFEKARVIPYLKKRGLVKQYLKQKQKIESGQYESVDLRKLEPKTLNRFYFKINSKYRACGYFLKGKGLVVTNIWDHQ